MSFFRKFFSCTCAEPPSPNHQGLPRRTKKSKPSLDITSPLKVVQNAKTSLSTEPQSNLSPKIFKKAMPAFRFMSCSEGGEGSHKIHDLGFLVGVISSSMVANKKIIPEQSMVVKIGRYNEIRNMLSLRPRCLDSVVVYWSDMGCQFSLMELLITDQRLVVVCDQWEVMMNLLKRIEEEIFRVFGESVLRDSVNRIFCNIVQKQGSFILEFIEGQWVELEVKKIIEDILDLQIGVECFDLLMLKMTLEDYANVRRYGQGQTRRIMHYLKQIDLELMQIAKSRKEGTSVYGTSRRMSSERSRVLGGRSDKKGRVSELNQEEIRYFNSRMNFSPSPHFENRIEGDLDIFNYNFEETVSPFQQSWFKRQNHASPSKNSKKIRTRSQDISGAESIPAGNYYDAEIFDKYK